MAQVQAPATAAQRRTAISAVRGVLLAVHATSGITASVDVEAVRLLRCCEGLVRAAAARLEALGREVAPPAQASPRPPAATNAGKQGKNGKDGMGLEGKDGKNDKAGKMSEKEAVSTVSAGDDADMGMAPGPRARPRLRRGKARAVVPPSAVGASPRDDWADDVVRDTTLENSEAPPPPALPRILVPPPRSPELEESECFLLEGHAACISGLLSRPELTGAPVTLVGFDHVTERWICKTQADEQLRVKPVNLTPVDELIYPFWKSRFPG